jgi:hypothetical protein
MKPPEGLADFEGVIAASETPAVVMIGRAWMRELLEYLHRLERECALGRLAMVGRRGSQWPEERQALLRQLDAEGLSFKAMGRRLNCSEETISRQRRHCGLPDRPSPIVPREQPEPAQRFHRGASTLPPLASLAGDER